MFDTISNERLEMVHPELARRLRKLASLLSFDIRLTQGLRTYSQQDGFWQQGRNPDGTYIDPRYHKGIVTNAKGGDSAHNFGYAGDVAPISAGVIDWDGRDEKWKEILAKATSCGLGEGATWRIFP